jgi:rare lipoprotein A (peptidoglycan hydrolase)
VSETGLQRTLALAAVALLAVLGALALARAVRDDDEPTEAIQPAPTWYESLAGTYRLDPENRRTACGYPADDETAGVSHPVLPCGAKVIIDFDEQVVLTQVVDRGTGAPGREFELTSALASRLGLRGVQPIRWTYAVRESS